MKTIAVLDTETNWNNRLMSIGAVIADGDSFKPLDTRYFILTPECFVGGMYDAVLTVRGIPVTALCPREEALKYLSLFFKEYGVERIFAYNARFDRALLPEFRGADWSDILAVAAYRQYNRRLPENAEYCRTGRLKRDYGVEPIMRLLTGDSRYFELHNALTDAKDELELMRLLGVPCESYPLLPR